MSTNLQSILTQIRQDSRSVRNRLQSILHDSQWVQQVHDTYDRPMIPNERCGLWYVPPQDVLESCYFKSTDGHTTQWAFSTRRLNLHLLELLVDHEGVIVVDSTRRGKTMPDAMSKTIPIWCATLNYVMFGESEEFGNWLFLPRQIVSEGEQDCISRLIPKFAKDFESLNVIGKQELMKRLKGRYIRPLWVYPGMKLPFEKPEYDAFYPVINCVASMKAQDGTVKMNGFTYVQGAADDHELWAKKLSPELFWQNVDVLKDLRKSDGELLEIIDLLKLKSGNGDFNVSEVVEVTDKLAIGKVIGDITDEDVVGYTIIVLLSKDFKFVVKDEKKILMYYALPSNKKGSNDLRKNLPEIIESLQSKWEDAKCLVVCDTGTDLCIGVLLTILCVNYNLNWSEEAGCIVTKDVVKRHLAKILSCKKVNPSRATLQSVNSFLM